MKLSVRAKQQTSSVFQHVTVYDAEIELTESGFDVEILEVEVLCPSPMDPDPDDLAAARSAILLGAQDVLAPRGLGAKIRVTRLLLHPVDFRADKFRHHTAEELAKLI